jgi:hypothetical protein
VFSLLFPLCNFTSSTDKASLRWPVMTLSLAMSGHQLNG